MKTPDLVQYEILCEICVNSTLTHDTWHMGLTFIANTPNNEWFEPFLQNRTHNIQNHLSLILLSMTELNLSRKAQRHNAHNICKSQNRVSTTLIHCLQSCLFNVISPVRFKTPMSKLKWSAHVRQGWPLFHLPWTDICSTLITSAELHLRRTCTYQRKCPSLEIDSTPKRHQKVTFDIWSVLMLPQIQRSLRISAVSSLHSWDFLNDQHSEVRTI